MDVLILVYGFLSFLYTFYNYNHKHVFMHVSEDACGCLMYMKAYIS